MQQPPLPYPTGRGRCQFYDSKDLLLLLNKITPYSAWWPLLPSMSRMMISLVISNDDWERVYVLRVTVLFHDWQRAAGLRTVEGTTTVGYNHKAGVQAFMVRAPFFRLFQKRIHLSITSLCKLQYETTYWEIYVVVALRKFLISDAIDLRACLFND